VESNQIEGECNKRVYPTTDKQTVRLIKNGWVDRSSSCEQKKTIMYECMQPFNEEQKDKERAKNTRQAGKACWMKRKEKSTIELCKVEKTEY
jgi:hypothetical protein